MRTPHVWSAQSTLEQDQKLAHTALRGLEHPPYSTGQCTTGILRCYYEHVVCLSLWDDANMYTYSFLATILTGDELTRYSLLASQTPWHTILKVRKQAFVRSSSCLLRSTYHMHKVLCWNKRGRYRACGHSSGKLLLGNGRVCIKIAALFTRISLSARQHVIESGEVMACPPHI